VTDRTQGLTERTAALTDRTAWLTDRLLVLPDGTFPHLAIRDDGRVAPVVLLCGSPERVEAIAGRLDDVEVVGAGRGYRVLTGWRDGARLSVATSGVGAPSMSIAVEELGACGARTFVRVGSCAAVSPRLGVGGIAISVAAVRDEGTSAYYAPATFPACASHDVVVALVAAAAARGVDAPTGTTRTTDSFYEGERTAELIERWSVLGVLAFEMETSCLFTVAAVRGWRAGSIVCAGSNLLTGAATYQGAGLDAYRDGQDRMIDVALDAARALADA
jgi:uridine phosphorylase